MNELLLSNTSVMVWGIGILSLCVGSLLNVIIYRLPLMQEAQWRQECCELLQIKEKKKTTSSINLFFPRSFCPHCKALVRAWQNIPLLSYLVLKGRCYHCHERISIRYPLIELLTLALSLYATWHFGLTLKLIFGLVAIWILICLVFIDLDHQLLPDSLTLGLLWLGLLANTQHLFTSINNAVFGAVIAYLSLWIFIKLFYLITGKIGMGHGDFKLFAAFGAWFGWALLPFILFMASIMGALIGFIYLKAYKKPKDTTIAFGPFLSISGFIVLFWGERIVSWYLQFLHF